jgi:N-acetylneuraminic acid mutarotase
VGTSGGRVIVAGGTYWKGTPWTGGTKHWVDTIYALDAEGKAWREVGTLPSPLAYGSAVSLDDGGMLLIGGQTDRVTHGKVWRLTLSTDTADVRPLPDLPCACGWTSAAVLDGAVYVAAGGEGWPAPAKAIRRFWSLNLRDAAPHWAELEPWPGAARFFAAMTAASGQLFLAGGADLKDGKRVFLKDAYRYKPGTGWSRIADLPAPRQAGYGAAIQGRPAVIGGNDGAWADRESDPAHPGFRREVLEYDDSRDRWIERGAMPVSLVTSGLTVWKEEIVIAGGEDKPGSRSARVVSARLPAH